MKWRVLSITVVVCLAGLLGASCTTEPGGTPPQPPGPETTVWMAGDSVSAATAATMFPKPYWTSQGGSGFLSALEDPIADQIAAAITEHGAPEAIMIMGGVVDVARFAPLGDVIAEMASIEADLVAQGIDVIWLAQPGWIHAQGLVPLSDWVNARPLSIDCRGVAGWSADGVHPFDYTGMSACINARLGALGYDL